MLRLTLPMMRAVKYSPVKTCEEVDGRGGETCRCRSKWLGPRLWSITVLSFGLSLIFNVHQLYRSIHSCNSNRIPSRYGMNPLQDDQSKTDLPQLD